MDAHRRNRHRCACRLAVYERPKILPTDANMDTILTIVAPYLMYIAAEEVHSSGVLAVVSGGLLLSNNRHNFLSTSSRLRGINVWESLAFALNGIVFILIGLELPEITSGLEGEYFIGYRLWFIDYGCFGIGKNPFCVRSRCCNADC